MFIKVDLPAPFSPTSVNFRAPPRLTSSLATAPGHSRGWSISTAYWFHLPGIRGISGFPLSFSPRLVYSPPGSGMPSAAGAMPRQPVRSAVTSVRM